ncbi:MAG: UDP-N-acetyl-D-mannosamine dehydrogenase [Gammaproteobacteria bacterium]|nr:UDP-N-acetyl-D-mannosamine dehydrogenase [Gammaproteobacteria bacterium]
MFKRISTIGLGYIGLPTAAVFAKHGIEVIGVDVKQEAVDTINRGEIHIVEPGLAGVVKNAVENGLLRATVTPEPADAFLIAVPTPFKKTGAEVPEPDLTYIESASRAIAPVLKKGDLVVLESTSPVGATERMADWLAEERPDLSFPQAKGEESDIRIAHCPERVLPGHVLEELISNDRVVGGMTSKCSELAVALYKTFVKGECVVTNARTAEMAKLTENSFRDVNIAFANELSIICDKLDIDVWELIALSNRHPRVNILQPGPGVGGHCIAVDPWFIVASAPDESKLIRAAREVNDQKPEWVVNKVKLAVADYLQANPDKTAKDVTVACYGLAFKPDIDDLRESPALNITKSIAEFHKGKLLVIEPNIDAITSTIGSEKLKLTSLQESFESADIHVLLVDHKEFKNQERPKTKYVVDTRGIWG